MLKKRRKTQKEKSAEMISVVLTRILVAAPVVAFILFSFALFAQQGLPFITSTFEESSSTFDFICQSSEWYRGGCVGEVPEELKGVAEDMVNATDDETIREKCYCVDTGWQ